LSDEWNPTGESIQGPAGPAGPAGPGWLWPPGPAWWLGQRKPLQWLDFNDHQRAIGSSDGSPAHLQRQALRPGLLLNSWAFRACARVACSGRLFGETISGWCQPEPDDLLSSDRGCCGPPWHPSATRASTAPPTGGCRASPQRRRRMWTAGTGGRDTIWDARATVTWRGLAFSICGAAWPFSWMPVTDSGARRRHPALFCALTNQVMSASVAS